MASREKKPLAPSKSKQKANNDSGLPSNEIKSKKGKVLSNLKQQLAHDILEAVATGSQLSVKLEAGLPRKKALKNLTRKQKLKTAKATLISKSKVTKKVPIKTIRKINPTVRKNFKTKKVKEEETVKITDNSALENHNNKEEIETNKSAKNIPKNKKNKSKEKIELEDKEPQNTDTPNKVGSKINRKGNVDSPKSAKSTKVTGIKKTVVKLEKDDSLRVVDTVVAKISKSKKLSCKDVDSIGNIKNTVNIEINKIDTIDLTITEVIASMLSDSDSVDLQCDSEEGDLEKIGTKVSKRKKMLIGEDVTGNVERQKESEEDVKPIIDGDFVETDHENVVQSRKKSGGISQRSLRNGKLRQSSDSSIVSDAESKKRRRINSDDPVGSEISSENIFDGNLDSESCFSESSGNDAQVTLFNDESKKFVEDQVDIRNQTENNNNSERIDRIGEGGPTLRSKTKAKITESDAKNEEKKIEIKSEVEEHWITPKTTFDEMKKPSLEQTRKDILMKLSERPKGRRSSLNIDIKKPVSLYGAEKSDSNNPKSQIDQMIENIKLTIAKSIESKIYGPEKGLGLSKNFELSTKVEEIIAPLSTQSQKLCLDEDDEEKPNISKNEIKSDSSENSVPKVADTAKEIEKLVMGDIEPVVLENKSSNIPDVHNVGVRFSGTVDVDHSTQTSDFNCQGSTASQSSQPVPEISNVTDNSSDLQLSSAQEEIVSVVTRKSSRILDKTTSSVETNAISENIKPFVTVSDKDVQVQKSEQNLSKFDDCSIKIVEDDLLTAIDHEFISETCPANKVNLPSTSMKMQDIQEQLTTEQGENVLLDTQDEFNISLGSDESETLESISREVEKLVASDSNFDDYDHLMKHPDNESNKIVNDVTKNCSINDEDNRLLSKEESIEMNEDCDLNIVGSKILPLLTTQSKNDDHGRSAGIIAIDDDSDINCVFDIRRISNKTKDYSDEESTSQKNIENQSKFIKVECEKDVEILKSDQKSEEQKGTMDENKRVLRTRDNKPKKNERKTRSGEQIEIKIKEETPSVLEDSLNDDLPLLSEDKSFLICEEVKNKEDSMIDHQNWDLLERQTRTRRSREIKKRKDDQPLNNSLKKRPRRELNKKSEQQKEETLLDNEVAKINENNRYLIKHRENLKLRGFSEGGQKDESEKLLDSVRSKSVNDLDTVNETIKPKEENLENEETIEMKTADTENNATPEIDKEGVMKSLEIVSKDSDEVSTSGESSSSIILSTTKILETPEDKARKESILRLLGLESLEKAAERLNHQRAKKEQYTGTLKTVIRVQKERERDKKRSRSPLKMVLKQGRGDGEGDSPEFYTIQKEFGASGLGDSSSGANRKFTTNHRHSCDEDIEEAIPKERQSLVIPEKSSSFSIHPGRLCADVCCYCFGKFGCLDTPMHLAQMKSDERRKKILSVERHLTKDSCLCDACYRHVDRKANTSPTNMQTKPPKQHRQLMVVKCSARDCRDPARHHVKRRWLLKIKPGLQNQVDIDWESSQHSSMSFCVSHYAKIERFLTCALCKRRLARNHTHQLGSTETDELSQRLVQQGIPVSLAVGTFVCKLCRYFTQLQLKYKDVENMNTNHRSFFKSYRKRILHCHDIEVLENEEDEIVQNNQSSKDKEKKKKTKCTTQMKSTNSKSPDSINTHSNSEKSTPEPAKNEGIHSEPDNENHTSEKNDMNEVSVPPTNNQYHLGIESAVEKLKKRKILDMSYTTFTTKTTLTTTTTTTTTATMTSTTAATATTTAMSTIDSPISCGSGSNEVIEILAMDKEVTLTRLPKRAKTQNDITPVVQRLGANPSISVRTLFPGEEEMNLHANIEFTNVREITPHGWEKCATMIQYDRDTKVLWQELQRPYGNQSSFLRHLILLEKYYRSGDLVLAPNASRNAINYSTSVQNRLISYEGPEKVDEPIMEPISSEFNNRRLSGGYILERERYFMPGTSSLKPTATSPVKGQQTSVLKLNPGVSIIKKPPPNLQRLNIPSTSVGTNGNTKKKDSNQKLPTTSGGKVFQLSEPDFKRLQNLKRQKLLFGEKQSVNPNSSSSPTTSSSLKTTSLFPKQAQAAAQTQFQRHLKMQQEMLNRQSRGDFEPLICDIRPLVNENSPTQNLLHNLNLPKSIQVTTKPSTPNSIQILPKIPKSLTVIPQTVTRPTDK